MFDIEKNYAEYIELIKSIDIDGIDDLVDYLNKSDFKVAPASTKYHNSVIGGLCAHSLNVYREMRRLIKLYIPEEEYNDPAFQRSVKVVALLHDLSKTDFYEMSVQNKKQYDPKGRMHDSIGNFDWIQVEGYKVKDVKEREYVYGDHGLNSFVLASKFIKLTDEEACAIINHHIGLDNSGRAREDVGEVLNRYPIATLLCTADTISAYIIENQYLVE